MDKKKSLKYSLIGLGPTLTDRIKSLFRFDSIRSYPSLFRRMYDAYLDYSEQSDTNTYILLEYSDTGELISTRYLSKEEFDELNNENI